MNSFGHNPDGLTRRFMDKYTFKVPIRPVDIRLEHLVFGAIRVGEQPFTIREV